MKKGILRLYIEAFFSKWDKTLLFISSGIFTVLVPIIEKAFKVEIDSVFDLVAGALFILSFSAANFLVYKESLFKIQDLNLQIKRLNDNSPQVHLYFCVGENKNTQITIPVREIPKGLDIEQEIQREKEILEKQWGSRTNTTHNDKKDFKSFSQIWAHTNLDDYYDDLKYYFKSINQKLEIESRVFELKIFLSNESNIHVDNISIRIIFPMCINLGTRDDRMKWYSYLNIDPSKPKRPDHLSSSRKNIYTDLPASFYLGSNIPVITHQEERVSGPTYKEKINEIEFHVKELFQESDEKELKSIPIYVTDDLINKDIKIPYEIRSPRLTETYKGFLNIKFVSGENQ